MSESKEDPELKMANEGHSNVIQIQEQCNNNQGMRTSVVKPVMLIPAYNPSVVSSERFMPLVMNLGSSSENSSSDCTPQHNTGNPCDRKDEKYWDRRQRNNEAARRSREKRRAHDMEMEQRVHQLIEENKKLKSELHHKVPVVSISGVPMSSVDVPSMPVFPVPQVAAVNLPRHNLKDERVQLIGQPQIASMPLKSEPMNEDEGYQNNMNKADTIQALKVHLHSMKSDIAENTDGLATLAYAADSLHTAINTNLSNQESLEDYKRSIIKEEVETSPHGYYSDASSDMPSSPEPRPVICSVSSAGVTQHTTYIPIQPRPSSATSVNIDSKYIDKRRRNNEAARKCRERRKQMVELRASKTDNLEAQNAELRKEVLCLMEEMKELRELLEKKKRMKKKENEDESGSESVKIKEEPVDQ